MPFLAQILVAIAMMVLSYVLTPKAKTPRSESTAEDMDDPTCEAGKPIAVIFGTVTIKSPNILWWGDKRMHEYDVKA